MWMQLNLIIAQHSSPRGQAKLATKVKFYSSTTTSCSAHWANKMVPFHLQPTQWACCLGLLQLPVCAYKGDTSYRAEWVSYKDNSPARSIHSLHSEMRQAPKRVRGSPNCHADSFPSVWFMAVRDGKWELSEQRRKWWKLHSEPATLCASIATRRSIYYNYRVSMRLYYFGVSNLCVWSDYWIFSLIIRWHISILANASWL